MLRNTHLLISLAIIFTTSCGGGGGGSNQSQVEENSGGVTTPPPQTITSNLSSQVKGTIHGTINYSGITREFILYVPTSYDSSSKQPLVFNFHGYGSNALEQMNYGDFRSLADANGFIVVHPDALDDIVGKSFWDVGGWSSSTHDDIKFVENLINVLMDKYSVDAKRIYSTGMSNGGFFSFHLACNLSQSFAAVASVAGSMTDDTFDACNPRKPTPVMQIHGSIDTVVPYAGINSVMKPISDVMTYWKENNGCDDYILALPGIHPGTTSWTEEYSYSNCLNGTQNIHTHVIGAGHIWPGSIYESIQSPYASSRIWNFFEAHDIDGAREN